MSASEHLTVASLSSTRCHAGGMGQRQAIYCGEHLQLFLAALDVRIPVPSLVLC